jgi:hypothetical protein
MEPADSDERVAALREEIRRAGQDARDKRRTRFGCCLGAGTCWLLFGVFAMLISRYDLPGDTPERQQLDLAIWFGIVSAALIAMPSLYARFLHWRLRSRIRRRLKDVSPAARAEILLPLRTDSRWETRAIVAPLLREFGLPAEVTPSGAPEACGDEASPAERSP